MVGIVTDDIKATVITDNLEISVIRCQPAILDRNDVDVSYPHRQMSRRFFVAVAGIAIDPDVHLSAGHDDARVIGLFVLLLFLHLFDLFHHPGHLLLHGLGKCLDGFGQVVGH